MSFSAASARRSFSRCSPMRARSRAFEEVAMSEAVVALVVALALGVYLVVTLIVPERF
jgi:K+-transporting ATPase KdpF subunit